MRRARVILLLAIPALLGGHGVTVVASAMQGQTDPPVQRAHLSPTSTDDGAQLQERVTSEESKAYLLFPQGGPPADPVLVRNAIASMLREQSSSCVALLLSGKLAYEDSEYPKALYELRRAKSLLEISPNYNQPPREGEPQWHALVLHNLALAYSALDRQREAVDTRREYEKLGYEKFERQNEIPRPSFCSMIDSMVKLGELEQAQRKVEAAQLSHPAGTDPESLWVQDSADLIAERAQADPAKNYTRYVDRLTDLNRKGLPEAPGLLDSLSYYADLIGATEDATQYRQRCAQFQDASSTLHPWKRLAELNIARGDWQQAKVALKECWQWQAQKRSCVQSQLESDTRLVLAEYYLAAGYPERAEYEAAILLNSSLRSGFSLFRFGEQREAGIIVANYMSEAGKEELYRENEKTLGRGAWGRLMSGSLGRVYRRWEQERRFRSLIIKRFSRALPLRDAFEVVDLPHWLWGDVIRLLGPDAARKLFTQYPLSAWQRDHYAQAIEVEIAAADGEWLSVAGDSMKAIECLPKEESLWRGRLCALRAESLRKLGRYSEALEWYRMAYTDYPAVLRQLNLSLPVSITSDGSDIGERFVQCLKNSPRFDTRRSAALDLVLEVHESDLVCRVRQPGLDKPVRVVSIPLLLLRHDGNDGALKPASLEQPLNELNRKLFCGVELSQEKHDFDALEGGQVR